jgi:hypothetical protein
VTPDIGTRSLALYVYADSDQPGSRTIVEYAKIQAIELTAIPSLALLAAPNPHTVTRIQLVVVHNTFSTAWKGSIESGHVLVDGMLNGWILPEGGLQGFSTTYQPGNAFRFAKWTSCVVLLGILLLALYTFIRWLVGRRKRHIIQSQLREPGVLP